MAPPPTTSTTTAPKLRSSCDSCGTAKVKCDRDQPKCGRCSALGIACVYGLSRQFGKPRRKRPATDLEATHRSKKRAAYVDENRNRQTTLGYAQLPALNESGRLEFSNSATDVPSSASGLASTLGMDVQNQFTSAFFTPMFLDEWPQLDSFGVGLDFPSAPNNSATGDRPSASVIEPVNSVTMDSACHQSHSCPREPYEILRDLICPSPFLHAPEADSDPVSAQLDQVLRCTRNAIDRLTRLLKCPCARSGHRVMVHASVVSRILLWYQQAAGWTCSNTWLSPPLALASSPTSSSASPSSPSPYETTTDTDTTSTPTLAQSTGFVVEHVPVSMGIFSIEDQNVQAAFRDQLVLSELKKTASLIDLFAPQVSCESSTNGVAGLHAHLGAWLRGEHSRTVKVLTTRLSALNESLNQH
jgi:hypothetical protein